MLTRRFGSLLGLCTIGLLAACSSASDATGSSESAATNNEAAKTPERISGIGEICALPNGTADIQIAGGKYAIVSTCSDAAKPGQAAILDLDDADFLLPLGKAGQENHRVRFSDDGSYLHYASFDRAAGSKTVQVRLRSANGQVDKNVPFFDSSIADSPELFAQRLQAFNVKLSPDGKTAVVYGYEKNGDKFEGRILIAKLDADESTLLKVTKGISPDADVTFSPDGSRLLILSTMGEKALANNEVPTQHAYEVKLGAEPKVTESPSWIFDGSAGDVTIVPGSFDGEKLVRFDSDPTSADGAGFLSIVKVDGTHVELSKTWEATSHSPVYMTDAEMHEANNVAAVRLVKSGATAGYLFPGAKTDAKTNTKTFTLYLSDGGANQKVVTADATSDGPAFANVVGGTVMYTALTGVGIVDLNSATQAAELIAQDDDTNIYYGVNISLDGKSVILMGATETATSYQTIELSSKTITDLKLPASNGDCGWDLSQVGMYKGYVSAFGKTSTATQECAALAEGKPQVFGFDPTGKAKSLEFTEVDLAAGAPVLDLSGFDRAVVSQCALDGSSCKTLIEVPPNFEGLYPAPTPPATDAGGDKPGTEPGKGDGDKPAKPSKPATSGDDDDDTVEAPKGPVVTKKPPTNGATTTETSSTNATDGTSKTLAVNGCSAAPGTSSPTGLAAFALFGLAVLGRRRKRD